MCNMKLKVENSNFVVTYICICFSQEYAGPIPDQQYAGPTPGPWISREDYENLLHEEFDRYVESMNQSQPHDRCSEVRAL